MLNFLENTWFLWWLLAILLILQWFHAISNDTKEGIDTHHDDDFSLPKVRSIRELVNGWRSVVR